MQPSYSIKRPPCESRGSASATAEWRPTSESYRAEPRYFVRLVILWASLITLGFALIHQPSVLCWVLGVVLNGLIFAHGVELQHQTLHGTGFKTVRLNTLFGHLLGLPMLVSFHAYRREHLWHHRHLGTRQNREFFAYENQGQHLSPTGLAKHAFNFRRLAKLLGSDYTPVARAIGVLVITSGLIVLPNLTLGWIASLLIAEVAHNLIELPEHFGCDVESRDVRRNTRSIRSNRLLTWYTNGNNLHVEHHLFPGVPMHRLLEVHERISGTYAHVNPSYRSFFNSVLKT